MHGNFIKRSQLYFIVSFLLLIGGGTLLLKLPWMMDPGKSISWADSLFTATSAVCVTGLSTVSTSHFSGAGQLIILALIQLGGLGVMSLSSSILLLLGREMSVSSTLMMSNLNDSPLSGTEGLLKTVLRYTLFSEIAGMLVMLPGFLMMDMPWFRAVYYSVFHSVSAFCNAGISPMDDSLISANLYIKIAVAVMIILGGIGFYVVYDIAMKARYPERRLSVNSKLVVLMTVLLLAGGTLLLKLFDSELLPWGDAFFQSVTARTAGFNSVNLNLLSPNSIIVLEILMLIGAAPGSTGGGMKVTAVGLAVAAMVSVIKGNRFTLLFYRKVPNTLVLRAFVVVVIYLIMVGVGLFLFVSVMPDETFHQSGFEVISAFGTVGLSLGTTGKLTLAGKLLISLYMFIGRVGPFTLLLFLMGREKNSKLEYPEERVVLG